MNVDVSDAYWSLGKNVNLIAPNINSERSISIDGDLNIILGHNHVDSDGNVIYNVEPKNKIDIRDAIFAGSMNANRIKIFDNHLDRNVQIKGGSIISSNEIDIDVASKLLIDSDELQAGSMLKIKANDISMINEDFSTALSNQVNITTISGGEDITLSAEDNINLTSVNIKSGNNITLNSGSVNITAGSKYSATDNYDRDYTIGFTDVHSTSSSAKDEVVRNTINAGGNVLISASNGDVNVAALSVDADNELNISASENINTHGASGFNINSKYIRKTDAF